MQLQKSRVLVVEDEAIIARDISSILEQLGYEVSGEASTKAEAIELASTTTTDLALMDIKLRGTADGIQTAAEIWSEFKIPVVFLTSHADSETLRRANQTQPFGYVVKPFSEADLKAAVEVALNRYAIHSQLERKQDWLEAALSSIADAIIATDSEGRIGYFNRAAEKLTGWSKNEALGLHFNTVVSTRDEKNQRLCPLLNYALQSNEPVPFINLIIRHKNGRERQIVGSMGPMRQSGSALLHGVVVIMRDASELESIDRAIDERDAFLRRSSEHLQQLSYALSHDLTEPVRNIHCFTQLLERQQDSKLDDASREYLTLISEGSKRIDAQLKALREFHHAGNSLAAAGNSSAQEACRSAIKDLQSSVLENKAEISFEDLPMVGIALPALHRIFKALLSNTIRFRSELTPKIQISALRHQGMWQFTVEDNGLGFDPREKDRIFQLFTRAHSPSLSGSGVGLAICHRLIESAGGRIWAESKLGNGSKFQFTLPFERREVYVA